MDIILGVTECAEYEVVCINIWLVNRSGTDVLFNTGEKECKVLGQNESISLPCAHGVLTLYLRHTYGSYACEPDFKHWYEKLGHLLVLMQTREYHASVSTTFVFSNLQNDSEIVISNRTKKFPHDYIYIECFFANPASGMLENMYHDVEGSDLLKSIYKRNERNIMLWASILWFILEGGLSILVFWIISSLASLFFNIKDTTSIGLLTAFLLLMAYLPGFIESLKEHRRGKKEFFYYLTSPCINSIINDANYYLERE